MLRLSYLRFRGLKVVSILVLLSNWNNRFIERKSVIYIRKMYCISILMLHSCEFHPRFPNIFLFICIWKFKAFCGLNLKYEFVPEQRNRPLQAGPKRPALGFAVGFFVASRAVWPQWPIHSLSFFPDSHLCLNSLDFAPGLLCDENMAEAAQDNESNQKNGTEVYPLSHEVRLFLLSLQSYT